MGDIVPREEVGKQGVRAVGGIAGGIGLLVLRSFSLAGFLAGGIAGGVLVLVGLAVTRSRSDRRAGWVTVAAGAAAILSGLPLVGGFGGALLLLSGVGLLAAGGWSAFQFIRNLRRRM